MKNKILAVFFSLLVAAGIWVYVITVENPESSAPFYNVPVVLEGESLLNERGLMLVGGKESTVTLELYGNRKYLNKLKSSDITVLADLTKIYGPGDQVLPYDVSLPGYIPDNSVQVQTRKPDGIPVEVDRRVTKSVDVYADYKGSVPEDFIVDKEHVVFSSPTVTVTGPEAVVSKIATARIDVDLSQRNESISENFRYSLCNRQGQPVDAALVTTNMEEIRMELRIQRRKEIKLSVHVVDGGGATRETSTIQIEPKTIWVSGNDLALSGLDTLELGTINLAEYPEAVNKVFDVILPEGITNESNVSKATVKVSFPNLTTREFAITEFKAVNLPSGMEADFLTTQLTVSVRGPKEKMAAMKAGDITVTVDCTGEEAGNATLNAKITLSDSFRGCGAVSSYSLSVTIRPREAVASDVADEAA